MRGRIRFPLFVAAAALLSLIGVLATLQYRWVGRISDAERERMKATLNARAAAFAQDLDRELSRAFLTFQFDGGPVQDTPSARTAARYDRWQTTARYPKLLKDIYVVMVDPVARVQRFNATTRLLEPVEWPASLEELRKAMKTEPVQQGSMIVRTLPAPLLEEVPAVIVPTPFVLFNRHGGGGEVTMASQLSCTVLVLDREYIQTDLLPALARQHFRGAGDGFDYQLAVVRPAANVVVYHSEPGFSPAPGTPVDASIDFFQVRLQDFEELVSEIRRLNTVVAPFPPGSRASRRPELAEGRSGAATAETNTAGDSKTRRAIVRETFTAPVGTGPFRFQQNGPLSIVVEQPGPAAPEKLTAAAGVVAGRLVRPAAPRWRLMVKHPSGSLERAVDSARRRNLLVSSGILAVLGISVGFLVVSTRRAHELARQQMEFVATVSHELRTPLAVIRSAADNLADGVITDGDHVRRYGELVRNEGRRLSDLVEQVLTYAGLQARAEPARTQTVSLSDLLREVAASAHALAEPSGVAIELTIPETLPAVAGDEAALRRVFQNLLSNAVKYGADGRWVGVHACVAGDSVEVAVSDRGIGIAAADQPRIFDPFYRAPDVMAAQIQGAGLGLSVVNRILDAHHGRISVKSAPGAGSTFIVTLPIAGADSTETASDVGAAAAQHS